MIAPLVQALPRNEQLKRAVRSIGVDDEVDRLGRIYTVIDRDLRRELLLDAASGEDEVTNAIVLWHADAARLDSLGRMLVRRRRASPSRTISCSMPTRCRWRSRWRRAFHFSISS